MAEERSQDIENAGKTKLRIVANRTKSIVIVIRKHALVNGRLGLNLTAAVRSAGKSVLNLDIANARMVRLERKDVLDKRQTGLAATKSVRLLGHPGGNGALVV